MSEIPRAARIRGRTIRYIWLEGPTKGKTHEHTFHPDGTVEWREVGGSPGAGTSRPKADEEKAERVPYAAMEAAGDVYLVSYRSTKGYTLSVALDFKTLGMVGVASGTEVWTPVQGRFEVVG